MRIPLVLVVALVIGTSVLRAQNVTGETVPGVTNFNRLETRIACAGATTPVAMTGLKR